jgi:predicted nucleotide-binding protein
LSPFHLVRPRADVKKDLRKQIFKGRDIWETKYNDDQVEYAIGRETKWDLLNIEILRRAFSDQSILNEYQAIRLTKYYGDWEARLNTQVVRVQKRITFLESVVERIKLIPEGGIGEQTTSATSGGERIFIIHGHDEASKSQVARLVERLDLTAVILSEQPNRGRTIIEKLERNSDVAFAVAILTPDDAVGTSRARQNVILELGQFMMKLGRDKVAILYKPDVELPSDIKGVAYYELDKAGAWQYGLAKELKAAGLPVDMNKI